MSTPSPAFEHGFFLGNLQRSIIKFAEDLSAGFALGAQPRAAVLTDEQREARAVMLHRRRLEHERLAGLRFVRSEANRVRRELGLPQVHEVIR